MFGLAKISIAVVLVGMMGCRRVQSGDLVGTWVITQNSRRALPADLQTSSGTIVVDADGTFVATELPALFYFPGTRRSISESGGGRWYLISQEHSRKIQLEFRPLANWDDGLPYGTQLYVPGNSLYYFYGDPDEARRISFEKKSLH